MPTDLTTAEKAERLGLRLRVDDRDHWWEDVETGASRLTRRCIGAEWQYFEDWRRWPTADEAIAALYAERFPSEPTPDYRAALEALVEAASAVTLTLANAAAAHGPVEDDQCRALLAALTHARKVLHVP